MKSKNDRQGNIVETKHISILFNLEVRQHNIHGYIHGWLKSNIHTWIYPWIISMYIGPIHIHGKPGLIGKKFANFAHPLSFSALVRGDPLRIYGTALRFLKLESSRQPTYSEDLMILACIVFD